MEGRAGGSAPCTADRELPLPTVLNSSRPPHPQAQTPVGAQLRTLSTCHPFPHWLGLLSAVVQRT